MVELILSPQVCTKFMEKGEGIINMGHLYCAATIIRSTVHNNITHKIYIILILHVCSINKQMGF